MNAGMDAAIGVFAPERAAIMMEKVALKAPGVNRDSVMEVFAEEKVGRR